MKPHVKSSAGFSLVEIMIAMLLMTGAIWTIMEIETSSSKAMLFMRTSLARDAVIQQLRTYLLNGKALNTSLATNAALSQCVNGTVANGCVEGTAYDLALMNPGGTAAVTGAPGSPVFYDSSGTLCPGASAASCPIEVSTSFSATCPAGFPSPCTTAQLITVNYTVKENAGLVKKYMGVLRESTGAVSHSVQDISNSTVTCPAGQYMSGINEDGSLICSP